MDRAILRPGRLGKLLYVPLPSPDERGLILKALAKKKPIDATVDLVAFGKNDSCSYLSGADLAALVCYNSTIILYMYFCRQLLLMSITFSHMHISLYL